MQVIYPHNNVHLSFFTILYTWSFMYSDVCWKYYPPCVTIKNMKIRTCCFEICLYLISVNMMIRLTTRNLIHVYYKCLLSWVSKSTTVINLKIAVRESRELSGEEIYLEINWIMKKTSPVRGIVFFYLTSSLNIIQYTNNSLGN